VSRIVGVVLAAGLSRRLGRPKQLLTLDDKPLIAHVVERALHSRLDEVIVVTGAHEDRIRAALDGLPIRFVHNTRYVDGQGTSLAAGIVSLGEEVDAAVILLSDQPSVSPDVINTEIDAWRLSQAPVVMARYGEQRGHPVLFGRELFPELMRLNGDTGGREVIRAHQAGVVLVDGGAPSPPADVDTYEAWNALQKAWANARQNC
jgi:molybdenum cofactor cytidylyltransferase